MMLTDVIAGYSRMLEISVQAIARRDVAETALAIERYRLAKGTLPDALGELVPAYLEAVPKDPFDGEELRYRRLETGYVVYSIGEDGRDDGGKERGEKPHENWDITFIVERQGGYSGWDGVFL